MLTILAWAMIFVFLGLIMTKKMQPFTALVVIPVVFGVIGAFLNLFREPLLAEATKAAEAKGEVVTKTLEDFTLFDQIKALGTWTVQGLSKTSTTALMLLFAILFFSIMLNAGLFDPVTKNIIKLAKGDPLKILVGTAVVAACVSLNGDGTTTTLICCTAFLPIYKKLNIKIMYFGVLVILMNTIMNLLPWGGPTARVISVLDGQPGMDSTTILNALVPGMVLSVLYMLGVAVYFGLKERKRIGIQTLTDKELEGLTVAPSKEEEALKRPHLIIPNAILTLGSIFLLVKNVFPSVFIFLMATCIALLLNYKKISEQKARIHENAGDALAVVILVIGAGVFMGVFTNSGMSDALAASMITLIPKSMGSFWGLITAIVSAPGTFFLSNDAFYYGVLPVFAEAGYSYGFTALEIGVASLLGQAFHLLSPLVAFIYLLLNLTGLDMGEWQKESAKWALGIFIIFIGVAAITGTVPLFK